MRDAVGTTPEAGDVATPTRPHTARLTRAVPGEFVNEQEQSFDAPIERVFPFFADARNLPRLIPDWISFRMVEPREIAMRVGATIDYRVRLHGVPFGWRSEITAWDPPHLFVDEQRRGPFRHWIHTHTFESIAPGRTLVRDVVRYGVPGGALVHRLLVERDLRRIFAHRRQALERIFY